MKKLAKLAALLAAAALLFGAAGCSGGDDDDPKSEPTLKSISVTANEDVKDHYNGDETEFDHTGITVTAHYSDETTKDVTGDATFTATYEDEDGAEKDFPVAEKGIYEVTVTAHYEGMEDTLKAPIIITVGDVVLERISIAADSTAKTTYEQGAAFDYTGITVTAYYDVGEPVVIPNDDVEFTATYGDDNSEFTTSLPPDEYLVTLTAKYKGKEASLDPVTITIKEADDDDDDDEEETYFKSFVASDLGLIADSSDYETLTATEKFVTMDRSKYQANEWSTADYDAEAGTGYTYTARVKVNKANSSGKGELTITNVKVGSVLRFDGGNAGDGTRKMGFKGTKETEKWEASDKHFGSFYATASASTVTLTSEDGEFCIYGIHVVDAKVAPTSTSSTTDYANPVVELSDTSIAAGESVTVKATATVTTTVAWSTGKVEATETDFTGEITYAITKDGTEYTAAQVTGGTFVPTEQGDYAITASYTAGGKTYSSEPVTLKVTAGFGEKTETVPNREDELGLVATGTPQSSDSTVATAVIDSGNIKITSHKKGTATITVSDGTNKATIDVTVDADGSITAKVHKYRLISTVTWSVESKDDLTGTSTLSGLVVGDVEGYAGNEKVAWVTTSKKFKYSGGSTQDTATFTTNLKDTAKNCISNGNYAQVEITNNTGAPVTLLSLAYTHAIGDKNTGYGCQALYWIGDVTGEGTALAASAYGSESAILTKADVSFADDVTVANGQKVTIRFAYYGGGNANKVCALKDVVLSVAK